MLKQKILIVPYWVRDSLWRGGHKIEDLLDFDKAQKLLSRNELAILEHMQTPEFAKEIFGDYIGDFGGSLASYWAERKPMRKEEIFAMHSKLDAASCVEEINARLMGKASPTTEDEKHVITEIAGFGLAVTVFPNIYVGANKANNSIALSREVCKLLYRYEGMSSVMLSPFGAKYIETLSR